MSNNWQMFDPTIDYNNQSGKRKREENRERVKGNDYKDLLEVNERKIQVAYPKKPRA